MYIGTSLVLLAAGAILRFAITAQVNGVNLPVIGDILMAVGALGLVLSVFLLTYRRRDVGYRRDRTTYVDPPAEPYDSRYDRPYDRRY